MEVLVAYDVNTETREGRKRLRRVCKVCLGYGDRVQKSVFECSLAPHELDELLRRLAGVIDPRRDSVRVYALRTGRGDSRAIRCLGIQRGGSRSSVVVV